MEPSKLQVKGFVKNNRHLFGIFGKKLNEFVTIRKKIVTIKQLIQLSLKSNYKMKKKIFLNQYMKTSMAFLSNGK